MKNYSRYLLKVLLPVIFIVIAIGIYMNSGVEINPSNYIYMDEDWDIIVREEVYENVSLSELKFDMANRGDKIVMTRVMPEEKMKYPVLEFYNIHSDIVVELDGKAIYTYGCEDYEQGKIVGYGYHFIPLSDDYMGKKLTITMRISENAAFTTIEIPCIANSYYLGRDFVSERRLALTIDLFLMLFGVCLAIIGALFMFKHDKMFRLMCIALFSVCIGVWSLCSYDMITIFTYNLQRKAYLEFMALYLAPLFLFAYFGNDAFKTKSKVRTNIYILILALYALFICAVFISQIANIAHFAQWLKVMHILAIVMALYLSVAFVSDIRRHRIENPVVYIGIIFMLMFVLFDLVRFNIQKYTNIVESAHFSSSLYIGTFIFIVALIVDFCMGIARALYADAESEALKKLAYTDTLTGLANRRSCEEYYDELDSSPSDYIVIGFDLNSLKKINDTYGHDEGDRYIASFGKIINEVFGNFGLVGRTGGDEFVVVIKDAAKADLEKQLEKMQKMIDAVNEKHEGWNMSTAYGVCAASEGGVKTIRYALKVADERMYRKKFEMKGILHDEADEKEM